MSQNQFSHECDNNNSPQQCKSKKSQKSKFNKTKGSQLQDEFSHAWKTYSEKSNLRLRKSKNAVIVLGTTKTGKSSLIRLFCGDDVKVSHSAIPGTTLSTLHQRQTESEEKAPNNFANWIDTRGSGDGLDSNETILKSIAKKMHDENVNNIQIIWMIAGDTTAKKDEYITQAKFINSLTNKGDKGSNPWESCLIIKKRAQWTEFDPMFDDELNEMEDKELNGVIEAAIDNGLQLDKKSKSQTEAFCKQHLFGFTGIEFEEFNEKTDKTLAKTLKIKPSKLKINDDDEWNRLKENGYLGNEQIKTQVINKLDQLRTFKLHFVNESCHNCAVRGDRRYIDINCHPKFEYFHDGKYASIGAKKAAANTMKQCATVCGVIGVAGVAIAESAAEFAAVCSVGAIPVAATGAFFFARGQLVKRWDCCDKDMKNVGCKQRCSFCKVLKGTGLCSLGAS